MKLPDLYLILDVEACGASAENHQPIYDVAEAALSAGARFFQFRAKTVAANVAWDMGRELTGLFAAYGALFLTNDRADLGRGLDSDGVHVPANGLPIPVVRRIFEQDIVGFSAHSIEEALMAQDTGATFVTYSPVFQSASKPGYEAVGIEALEAVCEAVSIPVFALGGVLPELIPELVTCGIHGVAVMGGICSADDPYLQTLRYLQMLEAS